MPLLSDTRRSVLCPSKQSPFASDGGASYITRVRHIVTRVRHIVTLSPSLSLYIVTVAIDGEGDDGGSDDGDDGGGDGGGDRVGR